MVPVVISLGLSGVLRLIIFGLALILLVLLLAQEINKNNYFL
jgi:hypothetical protein